MLTKKDLPFDLLKVIEPLAQANLDIIKLRKEDDSYYTFVETDNNSRSFFKIYVDGSKRIGNFAGGNYALEWKPANNSLNRSNLAQLDINKVRDAFQNWLQLIRDIHETPSVLDDNFVKHYADFYFKEFKILDEDADSYPFDPNQQELVELYLTSLSNSIEESGEQLTEETKNELVTDIRDILLNLSITTKNQVMKEITQVFGKLYKASKSLAKEIVPEAKKHLVKKLIDIGIDYGPKLLEFLKNNDTI